MQIRKGDVRAGDGGSSDAIRSDDGGIMCGVSMELQIFEDGIDGQKSYIYFGLTREELSSQ